MNIWHLPRHSHESYSRVMQKGNRVVTSMK